MSNQLKHPASRITHHVSRIAGLAALVGVLGCSQATAAIQVLGVQYQQDVPYNEFDCIWNDKTYPTNCPPRALGCNVHVYLKNPGPGSATINDVTVAGFSLEDSLVENAGVHNARSIYFMWDEPPPAILNAGEPVWYKGDPKTFPAGGVAQAVVRLRTPPVTASVAVGVNTTAGIVATNITKDANAPQLASIGYSHDLTKVHLHWRRPAGQPGAPVSVWMDGTNVTGWTTTASDPGLGFGASVITLPAALAPMSYHVFQGVYADGKIASASQRAWTNKFIYATYGTFMLEGSYTIEDWIAEASAHGFNNCQVQVGDVVGYMNTGAGEADCRARGFGYTSGDTTKFNSTDPPIDPDMFFLEDEPDAEEANMEKTFGSTEPGLFLPKGKSPMGILVMREIAVGESLRTLRPKTPTNVNLDGTFRPENYYAWGQAMDVTQVDPYYQRRLADVYWRDQQRIPLYQKATYIYAVAKATVTAAEPNPANILLYSCEWRCETGDCDAAYVGQVWPFPTPEAKRIEVYYALAAGAKGLGYWWLKPGYPSNGLADQNNPGAPQLWKELGLLGNEIKTVAPLLVTGHPVDLPMTPGPNLWARALAVGTDTMILFVVNDKYTNDFAGCHYTAVANATLTATLPAWMQPSPMAFEVAAGGLKAVNSQVNGTQLQLNLGTLQLTKMIVLTKNNLLPATIQQRYNQSVRSGVCTFASELCGNSAPAIVVQPQSQAVVVGANATFAVAGSGTPTPGYQWWFNGTNVAGATSNVFTRISAQPPDAGGYSVVVSNSLGVVTSAVATLTVSTNGVSPFITAPPQSQTVDQGNNATFTVTAGGGQPLSYQWRFNDGDLAGATDTTYTRFSVQPAHAGNYSVVITNLAGAITSAPAVLTVSVLCMPANLVNGGFETTNGTGVATGWTAYEVNGPSIKVWSVQTALPSPNGSQYQQIQAYNSTWTASAGVRQDVTGCAVGATYQISGWYRSNSDNGRARVRVSPTASTNWSTAIDLNPMADYGSSTNWATFSGTVVATGPSMTLWLDGRTIAGATGKVGCFDAVTISCVGATVRPTLDYKRQGNYLVFNWPTNHGNYGLIATTNLGAPWSSATPAPTVVNGTNFVTNTVSGEQKFYRLLRQ